MSIFDEERARRQEAKEKADKQKDKELKAKEKLTGVEFEGVMCSLHKEDQWGLFSVEDYVRSGQTIDFSFKNGNTLELTPENIDAFRAVWVPARQAFFPKQDKPKEDKVK